MALGNRDIMSGFLCQPFQIACSFENSGNSVFKLQILNCFFHNICNVTFLDLYSFQFILNTVVDFFVVANLFGKAKFIWEGHLCQQLQEWGFDTVYKTSSWNKIKKKKKNASYLCIKATEVNLIGTSAFVEQNNLASQFLRILDKKNRPWEKRTFLYKSVFCRLYALYKQLTCSLNHSLFTPLMNSEDVALFGQIRESVSWKL